MKRSAIVSLKNKLNRLKPYLSLDRNHDEQEQFEKKSEVSLHGEWQKENVTPFYFDGDYCLVREKSFPIKMKYGRYHFSQFIDAVQAWNDSPFTHPLSSKGFRPDQLFFFDTETTGLGGGAGNTIFLLGHASVKDDRIILKQHLLPRPGAEVPLYQSFLENINYTTLVTYNGKAFDWPQVKTRHTLVRDHVPKLPSFGHFDLFHAARRLWKHKLERLKLSVVEKEVLGVTREDDVPGFLAPMIYFDFVQSGNPSGLIGILKHNEMDILSLITLYTHLTFQLLSIDEKQTVTETYEVGRWFASIGETNAATETLSQIATGKELDSIKAKLALSFEWKKQKKWEKAKILWEEISQLPHGKMAFDVCIELAKLFEHKEKNIEKAIFYSEKAKCLLEERMKWSRTKEKMEYDEVIKRLERLGKKQEKLVRQSHLD